MCRPDQKERFNMKRRIALVMVFSMLLCGCGEKEENIHEKTSSSESTTVSTTTLTSGSGAEITTDAANAGISTNAGNTGNTVASNGGVSASTTVAGDGSVSIPWFSAVTYEGRIDGVSKVKYVFETLTSGYEVDLVNGTTTRFECEQGKDTILFSFDGRYDVATMTMSTDGMGHIVGTIDGTTYVFVDPVIEDSYNTGTIVTNGDPFVGIYTEEYAHRGVIAVNSNGDSYVVSIHWSSSAATSSEWTFTGSFNGRQVLYYDDCVKTNLTYSEDGSCTSEQVYTNGTGYIRIAEEGTKTGLTWSDDMENAGADAFFLKE